MCLQRGVETRGYRRGSDEGLRQSCQLVELEEQPGLQLGYQSGTVVAGPEQQVGWQLARPLGMATVDFDDVDQTDELVHASDVELVPLSQPAAASCYRWPRNSEHGRLAPGALVRHVGARWKLEKQKSEQAIRAFVACATLVSANWGFPFLPDAPGVLEGVLLRERPEYLDPGSRDLDRILCH